MEVYGQEPKVKYIDYKEQRGIIIEKHPSLYNIEAQRYMGSIEFVVSKHLWDSIQEDITKGITSCTYVDRNSDLTIKTSEVKGKIKLSIKEYNFKIDITLPHNLEEGMVALK